MPLKACVRAACAIVMLLLVGGNGVSQPAVKDRIMRPVNPSEMARLQGTAHPLAKSQFDQGRSRSDLAISGEMVFRLSPAQQVDLDRLLRDQQDSSSANYHNWLSPEQYAERFGMSRNDLAKASEWLKSQGMNVEGISRSRTELYFSGTAAQVENTFRTEIHRYLVGGEEHFANATPLSLPISLADVVLTVRGVDNFRPHPHTRLSTVDPVPHFTSDISGRHFLNPNDFAVIYNLLPLYNAGLDGTGVKIAVIGQSLIALGGNSTADLDAFRTAAGLPAKVPSFVLVPSTGNGHFVAGDATEADLDLEWTSAVAKNASVIYVYSGGNGDAFRAISYAVSHDVAPIISNSFGLCEADVGQSSALAMWQTVRQASAQGQTITSASGDAGAADCDGDSATVPKSASQGLTVDIPAAIPEVVGVGGTEFSGDSDVCDPVAGCPKTTPCPNGNAPADSTFWAGACDLSSPLATAQKYISEIAWNNTQQNGELSASGGGSSSFFAKPSWQAGTGVPADGARDVPDVALSASPDHDAYLICSQPFYASAKTPPMSCANGFRASDNTLTAIGGTSAGAPTFAGILALILQATGGTGLGNVNPMLYSIASSSASAFHDTPAGSNNKVPCAAGSKDCPAGTTSIGFSTGTGYDQVTGLGSVDADQLEAAWLGATPSADFTMDAQTAAISAPGQSGSSTINVTASNGFADTVNLTCAPSSDTAQISCTLTPNSVALSSSTKTQKATLSVTTVAALEPASPRGTWFAATGGILAALILGVIPSRRRRTVAFFGLALIISAIITIGCGGGGGGATPQQKTQGTPAGAYTLTVTATGANTGISHNMSVSLVVK